MHHLLKYTALVLLLVCKFSLAESASNSKPPMPQYYWDFCEAKCPGNGGQWDYYSTNKPVKVYADRSVKSKIVFEIKKRSDSFAQLKRVNVIKKYGVEEVIKSPNDCNYKVGAIIYSLAYYGEGESDYWHEGKISQCSLVNEDSVKVISQPINEDWIKVKNTKGQVGWTLTDNLSNSNY